jgi:hypothetical protein
MHYLIEVNKKNQLMYNVFGLCVRWHLELLNFKISTNEN